MKHATRELDYIQPGDVISPKRQWTLMDVLYEERDYSVAIGRWDKKLCLGMRWNGSKDKRIGNPQSRGLPTWFIVPAVFQKSILDSLPDGDSSKVAYARFLLSRK